MFKKEAPPPLSTSMFHQNDRYRQTGRQTGKQTDRWKRRRYNMTEALCCQLEVTDGVGVMFDRLVSVWPLTLHSELFPSCTVARHARDEHMVFYEFVVTVVTSGFQSSFEVGFTCCSGKLPYWGWTADPNPKLPPNQITGKTRSVVVQELYRKELSEVKIFL